VTSRYEYYFVVLKTWFYSNTGHNIKWDHFDILASSKTDYHCQVKETLFIQELQPALKANVKSEKLSLYYESFSIVSLNRQFPFETS